ncbi:MAG: hypothetical protein KOO66_06290 [Bacteroidales bacterium]|nr:hypothetical protein [Bacteroidales bacterium]
MIKLFRETIESLKSRIKFNLSLIHSNEEKIKEILKEPVSDLRSKKLSYRFNFNKRLLHENADGIKLQKELSGYIENYHSKTELFSEISSTLNQSVEKDSIKNEVNEISKEDYFDLTINGAVNFDILHPYFKDESFTNDLLEYFTKTEDYEKCTELVNIKNSQPSEGSS